MIQKCVQRWGSNSGDLQSVKYLFIAITPKSTLTQSHIIDVLWHKVWDCNLKVIKFKLQSLYYIHFWTNTLGKVMNLLISPPPIG